MSFCLTVFLSVCLSVFLTFCLFVFLSFCLSNRPSVCLSVFLSLCLSVSLFFCPSVLLSVYSSIFLSLIHNGDYVHSLTVPPSNITEALKHKQTFCRELNSKFGNYTYIFGNLIYTRQLSKKTILRYCDPFELITIS